MAMVLNDNSNLIDENVSTGLIDCDVHPFINSLDELIPYMDVSLQRRMNLGKFNKSKVLKNMNAGAFVFPTARYVNPGYVLRLDAVPPDGSVPGSNPQHVTQDLFDRFGTTYGILNAGHGSMSAYHNVNLAVEYSKVYNDWLYEKWVDSDTRFRMTMVCAPLDAQETVREIERIGKKSGVVGINLQDTHIPLGNKHFWPIYEIAEAYDLPIVLHPDAVGAGEYGPFQCVGPATTYMEWHTALALIAQRQVISLVCEGVFDRFPKLKFVFVEYGFSWLSTIMWRLDKNWKGLRDEVPWIKRLPSDYIKSSVRVTTQPIEEPFRPKDLLAVVQMIGAEHMLMFSSDYPHWDGDNSDRILLQFPKELKRKIFYENAMETYKF
jgi:predicted TIM-barrel fold metal-dependent hydrolase